MALDQALRRALRLASCGPRCVPSGRGPKQSPLQSEKCTLPRGEEMGRVNLPPQGLPPVLLAWSFLKVIFLVPVSVCNLWCGAVGWLASRNLLGSPVFDVKADRPDISSSQAVPVGWACYVPHEDECSYDFVKVVSARWVLVQVLRQNCNEPTDGFTLHRAVAPRHRTSGFPSWYFLLLPGSGREPWLA